VLGVLEHDLLKSREQRVHFDCAETATPWTSDAGGTANDLSSLEIPGQTCSMYLPSTPTTWKLNDLLH
jgi:hypothetical protein